MSAPRQWWQLHSTIDGHLRSEWEAVGVDGYAALRAWERLGVTSPDEVRVWRGVVDSLDEAATWRQRVSTPQEAAAWKRTCGSVAEVDQWLSISARVEQVAAVKGVMNFHEIRQWTRCRFSTFAEIEPWVIQRIPPAEAKAWRKAGLSPEAAAEWTAHHFGARDAARWSEAGIAPSAAADLRVRGFSPRSAAKWPGFEPAEAAEWAKAGFRPDRALQWRHYVPGVAASAAAEWSRAKFAPEEVHHWRHFHPGLTPLDARSWRDNGFTPEATYDWMVAGFYDPVVADEWRLVGDPRVIAPWRDSGVDPAAAAAWIAAGADVGAALRWIRAGVEVNDAAMWEAAGCDPEAAGSLHGFGVDPRTLGPWGQVGVAPEHVPSWLRHGFSPSTAHRWVQAGFHADDAAPWRDLPIRPEHAPSWTEYGGPAAFQEWVGAELADPESGPPRALTEGMTTLEVTRWIDLGASPGAVVDWHQGWGISFAEAWTSTLSCELDDALAWFRSELDLEVAAEWKAVVASPTEVGPWQQMGLTATDAIAWTGQGQEPSSVASWVDRFADDALDWCSACAGDLGHAETWATHGWAPAEVARWERAGVRSPLIARRWSAVGVDAELVDSWTELGIRDPSQPEAVVADGGEVQEAQSWARLGCLTPGEALRWRGQWTIPAASLWVNGLGCGLDEAHSWYAATAGQLDVAYAMSEAHVPSERARVWLDAMPPSDVLEWIAVGVVAVEQAQAWLAAGIDAAAAIGWRSNGFSVDAAVSWSTVDVDPLAAARWRRIVSEPSIAQDWVDAGEGDPADVEVWIRHNISIADAARLRVLRFDPRSYDDLAARGSVAAEVRRRALRHAGFDLMGDVPVLEVSDNDIVGVEATIAFRSELLGGVGEGALVIRHGAPHLSPEAIVAVPGARYVRGGAKAAVWWAVGPSSGKVCRGVVAGTAVAIEGGGATFIRLALPRACGEIVSLADVQAVA